MLRWVDLSRDALTFVGLYSSPFGKWLEFLQGIRAQIQPLASSGQTEKRPLSENVESCWGVVVKRGAKKQMLLKASSLELWKLYGSDIAKGVRGYIAPPPGTTP